MMACMFGIVKHIGDANFARIILYTHNITECEWAWHNFDYEKINLKDGIIYNRIYYDYDYYDRFLFNFNNFNSSKI